MPEADPEAQSAEAETESRAVWPIGREGRFRLRDLDRWGRVLAVLLALGLIAAPVRAAVVEMSRWTPQGDDALIELRARDVGTSRTPLVGQPSTSGAYGTSSENVAHPGPLGFYVLVPGIRLLGATAGILLTTAAIAAASALVVAWVIFRQAGPRAGAFGAVLCTLAMWTAGGAGLLDPISSNFGRFPLVATAVLTWALACGDIRLAPLAAAFWSFAAQQHLSVLPAAAVLAAAVIVALIAVAVATVRAKGRSALRPLLGWVAAGLGVGLLAMPVLVDQIRHDPGNLRALARYSGDEARDDLGPANALGQVAHTLGLPPFLGRSGVEGWDLVAEPGPVQEITAVVALIVLVGGAWWARRREPGLTALVATVGVVAVGGVLTGMNVPDSSEQGRLNFFHWAFALSLLELLALAWLAALVGRTFLTSRHERPRFTPVQVDRALGLTAVAVVGVLAIAPLALDRRSDRLQQPVDRDVVDRLVGAIRDDPRVRRADGPLLTLVDGNEAYVQLGDTVRTRLIADGIDATFPPSAKGFAHPDRIVDPCRVDRALVIGLDLDGESKVPGREIIHVPAVPGFDLDAFHRLVDQAQGHHAVLGSDLEEALDRLPGDQGNLVGAVMAFHLGDQPADVLRTKSNVKMLLDHPPEEPKLDRDDLRTLLDSFPDDTDAIPATRISAHILDRDDLKGWLSGCG